MTDTQPPTAAEPQYSPNGNAPGKAKVDPFDPAALRLNAMADVDVESVLTAVPVRKPKRTEFFRVHPDPAYTLITWLLERDTGSDTEAYLVAHEVQHLVASELRQVHLYTAINKLGTVFLWPVKVPRDDSDRTHRIFNTALQCAEQAKTLWVKMLWNRDLGGYEMQRAKGDLGEPQWRNRSFRDHLELAFSHHLIDEPTHAAIKELAGEL